MMGSPRHSFKQAGIWSLVCGGCDHRTSLKPKAVDEYYMLKPRVQRSALMSLRHAPDGGGVRDGTCNDTGSELLSVTVGRIERSMARVDSTNGKADS